MNEQKELWDNLFGGIKAAKPQYDLWLDKYKDILHSSKDIPIIDLGCGGGNDTLYLKERRYEVISCDFSQAALERLKHFIDNPITKHFDMQEGLPFKDKSAKVIISDLSLHYFSWEITNRVLEDIHRVLMKNGVLLCRVNSVNDTYYGANKGIEIERNYRNIDGKLKRYFDKSQLEELFKDWEIIYMNEYKMLRYDHEKILWEVAVRAQ